jgi:hypothetical protein
MAPTGVETKFATSRIAPITLHPFICLLAVMIFFGAGRRVRRIALFLVTTHAQVKYSWPFQQPQKILSQGQAIRLLRD